MRPDSLEEALALAVRAATAPALALRAAFRSRSIAVESKADGSPVTAADRAAESAVRAVLRSSRLLGELEILGEEHGLDERAGDLRWVVDPIDGTLSFTRGLPAFGTIVALEEKQSGRALVGVIHLPMSGETYRAARGLGAWCGGERLVASLRAELRRALVSLPDSGVFRRAGLWEARELLGAQSDFARGYSDCWAHAMAARGALDLVLDPALNPWDVRASQVLLEEAGGRVRLRPSREAGKVDALLGSAPLVDALAARLGF